MAENEVVPLFTSLRSLGRYVDEQITHLKAEMTIPAGQKPYNYDVGHRKIKKEVQDLKNLSSEVDHNLKSVANFSGYLESMQEHLHQQATDISKMERYLTKFGYVPLQKPSSEKQNAVKEKEEGSVKEAEDTTATQKSGKKPASSSMPDAKSINQVSTSGSVIAQNSVGIKNTQPSNSRDGARQSVSLASLSRSYVTVDQWLAGIEENVDLTPDVLRKTSIRKNLLHPPIMELGKSDQSSDGLKLQLDTALRVPLITGNKSKDTSNQIPSGPQIKSVPKDSCCDFSSPGEPQFSEYTMQLLMMKPTFVKKDITDDTISAPELKLACSMTPEEPGFSFSSVEPQLTVASREISTPEEPIFPFQDYQTSKTIVITPEEPIRPNIQQRNFSSQKENIFGESAVTIQKERPVEQNADKLQTLQKYHRECPCSPELSEMTRSILSLSLQHRKDLYNRESCLEQPKNQPICSSRNSKNIEHVPLERSVSDNSLGSKLLLRHSSDITFPSEADQIGKMTWRHPGVSIQHFLESDEIPPSPKLFDITHKIIGQLRK